MSDKLKQFIILFSYTISAIYIYVLGEGYQRYLRRIASSTFNINYLTIAFYTVFPIVIGLLISLPSFVMEVRKKGKWQINWVKFIAVGIPVLYVTIFPLVGFTLGGSFLFNAVYPLPLRMAFGLYMPSKLSGVIFGYILLNVFYRVDSNESIVTEEVKIN